MTPMTRESGALMGPDHRIPGPARSIARFGQFGTLFLVRFVLPDVRVPFALTQVAAELRAELSLPRLRVHVPEKHVAIFIARYQGPAIGAESHCQHPILMTAQGLER